MTVVDPFDVEECEACMGAGRIQTFVTREMALDAGDPKLEGVSEPFDCPKCGGTGVLNEEKERS